MQNLVSKIQDSMIGSDPWQKIKDTTKFQVTQITPPEILPLLSDKKKVMILTGAGISAASNIPTFRGSKGIWKQKYKFCDTPEELATRKFFEAHPEVKWQFTWDFIELVKQNKPNAGHYAVK